MAIDVCADPSGQVAPLLRRPRSARTTIDLLLTEFLHSAVCGLLLVIFERQTVSLSLSLSLFCLIFSPLLDYLSLHPNSLDPVPFAVSENYY